MLDLAASAVRRMSQLALGDVIMLAVVMILVYEARIGSRAARAWLLARIGGRAGTSIINMSAYRSTSLPPVQHPEVKPPALARAHHGQATVRVGSGTHLAAVKPRTRWGLTLLVVGVALMFIGTRVTRPAAGRT